QFPEEMRSAFLSHSNSPEAQAMRELIRTPSVREIMEKDGKLQLSRPTRGRTNEANQERTPNMPAADGAIPNQSASNRQPLQIMSAMRRNGGWDLVVHCDQQVDSGEARPAGHSIWTRGRCFGNQFEVSFAELPKQAVIEVRARTTDGFVLGPYSMPFDAIA